MIVALKFKLALSITKSSSHMSGWYNSTKHNQNTGILATDIKLLLKAVATAGNLAIISSFLTL
jgi:hypothetical protein